MKIKKFKLQCNEDYDYHQEVARSSYADMLHDTERNKKYGAALKIAIEHIHSKGQKAHVLDIGTGTGLLSMLAVRHGADSVIACEGFTPMSQCALRIIKVNGFADKIKVVPKRSTDLTLGIDGDMNVRANILVTEVFDTELIGEGALHTFKKAHEELLEKDCIVIPQSAVMYAQIVESPLVQNWNNLKDIYNEDGNILLKTPGEVKKCPGAVAVHDIQMSQLPIEMIKTIISPQVVFRFDWSGKTPLEYERRNVLSLEAKQDGTAQAVFMWWELTMDFNNSIILSCAPYWAHPDKSHNGKEDIPWRDHWMQAVYYLPADVKVTEETFPKSIRIGQMNDGIRSKKYAALFKKYINKESIVLILSHGFYHGLIAANLGAKKVVCVEPNILSRSFMKTFVKCNNLDCVEIIQSIDDLHDLSDGLKFNIVFSEPHFNTSIIPWDNLSYIYLLRSFKEFCVDDVQVFPKVARIMGMAVEFSDLHKIRAPLKVCEDFLMEPFDELIEVSSSISDDSVEAQPLWEYPCRALSQPITIANVSASELSSIDVTGNFNIEGNGTCNGIALWVDWIFDEEYTITTGPIAQVEINECVKWDMHVRQGVQLINNRDFQGRIDYTFSFNHDFGEISFKVC
ncbi:putative arginine methyltransferase [Trypoxylus dichotomus]